MGNIEQAIHKAIAGGWLDGTAFNPNEPYKIEWAKHLDDYYVCVRQGAAYGGVKSVEELIYNHGFAKALWGNGLFVIEESDIPQIIGDNHSPGSVIHWSSSKPPKVRRIARSDWKYHLQQMVITPDPIEYLAQNLPNTSGRYFATLTKGAKDE